MVFLLEDSPVSYLAKFISTAYPQVLSYARGSGNLINTAKQLPEDTTIVFVYDLPAYAPNSVRCHNKLTNYQRRFRPSAILLPIPCAEAVLYAFLVTHGLSAKIDCALPENQEHAFKVIIRNCIQECARPLGKFYVDTCACCNTDLLHLSALQKSDAFFKFGEIIPDTERIVKQLEYVNNTVPARNVNNITHIQKLPDISYILSHNYSSVEVLPGVYDVVLK